MRVTQTMQNFPRLQAHIVVQECPAPRIFLYFITDSLENLGTARFWVWNNKQTVQSPNNQTWGHKKQTTQPYFGRPKNKSTPSNNSVLIKFVKPMPLSSKLLKPFEFLFGGELKVAVCSFACTLGSCQNGPQSNLTVLRQGCGLEVLSLGPLGTPSWLGRWIRRVTCVTQIIDGWQNPMIIHGRTAESLLYKILLTVFDQLEIKFYMLKMGKIYDDSDLSSTTSKLKSQCLLLGIYLGLLTDPSTANILTKLAVFLRAGATRGRKIGSPCPTHKQWMTFENGESTKKSGFR